MKAGFFLTRRLVFANILKHDFAAIAQAVVRILGKDEVTSSNLVSSFRNRKYRTTCFRFFFGMILLWRKNKVSFGNMAVCCF